MQTLEFANKKSTSKNQKTEQVVEEKENIREVKGRALATSRNVYRLLGADVYYVQSERSNEIYYYVKYIFNSFEWCSCLDNSIRGIKCKHQFSIEYAIRLGTLKDIDKLPEGAKKYPEVITAAEATTKSYEEDDYDF